MSQFCLSCIEMEGKTSVSLLVSIFLPGCFGTGANSPRDILLTAIAGTSGTLPFSASILETRLATLHDAGFPGRSIAIAPGSIKAMRAPEGFTPEGLAEIVFDFGQNILRLETGETFSLSSVFSAPRDYLPQAAIRYDLPHTQHPFSRCHCSDEKSCEPEDLVAGSLATGICDACLPGSFQVFREDLFELVGFLAFRAGLFRDCEPSTSPSCATMALRNMYSLFFSARYLCSDRGWCPQDAALAPDFSRCRAVSLDGPYQFGRQLAPKIAAIDENHTPSTLLAALIKQDGDDLSQYSIDLKHLFEPRSAHGEAALSRVIRDLLDFTRALTDSQDSPANA